MGTDVCGEGLKRDILGIWLIFESSSMCIEGFFFAAFSFGLHIFSNKDARNQQDQSCRSTALKYGIIVFFDMRN